MKYQKQEMLAYGLSFQKVKYKLILKYFYDC